MQRAALAFNEEHTLCAVPAWGCLCGGAIHVSATLSAIEDPTLDSGNERREVRNVWVDPDPHGLLVAGPQGTCLEHARQKFWLARDSTSRLQRWW